MAEAKKKPGRPPGSKNKNKKNASKKEDIKEMQEKRKADKRVIDEIWGVIFIAIGIFVFAAVQFNAAGQLGTIIGEVLKGIFGLMGVLVPWYLIGFGILLLANKTVHLSWKSFTLVFVILLMLCLINSGRFIDENHLTFQFSQFYEKGITMDNGGFFGMTVGTFLVKTIGLVGLYIFSGVVIIISLLLVINTPISRGIEGISNKIEQRKLLKEEEKEESAAKEKPQQKEEQQSFFKPKTHDVKIITPFDDEPKANDSKDKNILKYMSDDLLFTEGQKPETATKSYGLDGETHPQPGYGLDGSSFPEESEDIMGVDGIIAREPEPRLTKKEASEITLDPEELSTKKRTGKYKKPSIDLLNMGKASDRTNANSDLKEKASKLEETLKNFHVDARVVQVTQGPAVTRYEIQPNVGVKVNSIVRLADDIALNLEAKSIRIEAPIPGKAAVGIEVENDHINMVALREIVDSREFKSAKSKITFAVGKDIAGKAIVADLKSMPHLLIAGSTGSGKSVCINSIITSILYKADPDEVKLVLIDPKVVELGNYNGIPHLLIPVVTEPTKAAAALNWAVAEMTDRYKRFAENSVRDLESYNDAMKAKGEKDEVLPQIVIIIDELADLMMAAPSQVEESICRLAQMARAAGMHLIVATQRPSVDIITGVIKANIPSRIAFAVSSQFDSRTILDMSGAEKLVGKGDMLFNPLGMGKPVRVQGTFISDTEVHSVIEHVKSQVEDVEYAGEVINTIEKGNLPQSKDDDGDELLPEAIECVVTAGQASVSMLQRRFRIGYNRAARIVDMMEARGIVGPQDGSRPRQVLLTEDELLAMKEEVDGLNQ